MQIYIPIFLITLLAISCHTSPDYYPPKNAEMSSGTYDHYKALLDSAYRKKDHFEVAIQLANLEAPNDKAFHQLDIGIRENSQNCYRVYEWYKLFKEDNFQVNLVRADTTRFIEAYSLCVDLLGTQAFVDFQKEKEENYALGIENREKLDSSKFDQDLIKLLEEIELSDQEVRIRGNEKNISKTEEVAIQKEMVHIDSINLLRVEVLLNKYGYPKKEMVGYELASTVWLVLHHQSDIRIRDKYQKLIEQNASEGQIKSYNWRSEDIRLEMENTN